jgi:long-subunit fatty acid transport protein
LIAPDGKNRWKPAVDFTDGSLSISETGTSDQYTLSWAGNISNQWYIGIGLNIPTINYTKHTSLQESNKSNSAELKSMFHVSGVGVSGSLGLIYRPIQALRIGASLQTPTVMNLSRQTTGDMYSTIAGQRYEILTPESGVMDIKIASPLRTSVSIAGQIGKIGLIAVQYDYAHSKEMEDMHTLRIGAEAQAYRGLFFNAGYVYESSFMREEEPKWLLGYNEIRTDMDYRYTAATQYASAGIGYRCDKVVAQLAYQYSWQTIHQYASEEQTLPFHVDTHTHRIVATLAWRF